MEMALIIFLVLKNYHTHKGRKAQIKLTKHLLGQRAKLVDSKILDT
jgi:hypothetical protein